MATKCWMPAGREIGYVTSGSPAPFLKKNIALAYVPPEFAAIGTAVKVEIRGQGVGAVVVTTPFYKRPKKKEFITPFETAVSAKIR